MAAFVNDDGSIVPLSKSPVPNVKLTPDDSLMAAPLVPAAPPLLLLFGPAAGDCSLSPPTPPVCPPA